MVQISALPMLDSRQVCAFSYAIGSKFVGHDGSRHVAQTLQRFAEKALAGLRVMSALSKHIEYAAMLIKRSPVVVQFALNADENLAQKPFVTGLWPPHPEGVSIGTSEAQPPLTDGLEADPNARTPKISSTSRRLRLKQ